MDLIKKHYEKILLGLVLLGLAGAVVYMLIQIPKEKAELKETTQKRTVLNNKPLPAPETERFQAAYGRLEHPAPLNLAGTHNVFNPVAWVKDSTSGGLKKALTGSEVGPTAVSVAKMNPLYTTVAFEQAGADGGTYLISIQRDAEIKSLNRRKQSKYAKLNEKGEFFTLREVKGPADNPELKLEMADNGEMVAIAPGKAFQRVDGYSVDLEYKPEGKKWMAKRIGDPLGYFAGDTFTVAGINLVATNQFEVILSSKSSSKKTTIRFSAGM